MKIVKEAIYASILDYDVSLESCYNIATDKHNDNEFKMNPLLSAEKLHLYN